MAYTGLNEIQDEFKNIAFSSTTSPSNSAVTRFIVEAEAYVNTRLRTKYILPLNDPDAINLVKSIVIMLVVSRVKEIIRIQTGDSKTSQESRGGSSLRQDAIKMLDSIIKDEISLPNSQIVTAYNGVDSFDIDNNDPFIFEKNRDQW